MNSIDRVNAVLQGDRPDRPPVSLWHHFTTDEQRGQAAIDAHLRHLDRWKLDFLKIMNDTGIPRPAPEFVVRSPADLAKLRALTAEEPEFAAELEIVDTLAERLRGRVLTTVTLFNAWAVLRMLCRPPSNVHRPPKLGADDDRDQRISELLRADRQAVKGALETIGQSLATFTAACIDAGADGVFLSVRDDWVDNARNGPGTYDELVKPVDLSILGSAGAGRFNMLHICGKAKRFERFATYPVHAINWADRYAGPSIAEAAKATKPALCAGLDNLGTMVSGTPEQCAAEVADALLHAGDRPLMIAPGCTYDPAVVPDANVAAIVSAVRGA